jgi:hypothetical protein
MSKISFFVAQGTYHFFGASIFFWWNASIF